MPRCNSIVLILVAATPGLCAEKPRVDAPASAARQADPIAAQRQAIAVMWASLEVQRAALARQISSPAANAFFLLPPPSRTSAAASVPNSNCDPLPASELNPLIEEAAKRERLQPDLLHGVVRQESGARPCAVSPKGAMGLMQLMPATAKALGVGNPFDPKQSVDAGARFLRTLLDAYGDLPRALAAYNAGPARVNASGGVPDIPETVQYVQKIVGALPPGRTEK
jgi:soluble lytic murein transglycosylase-like protein